LEIIKFKEEIYLIQQNKGERGENMKVLTLHLLLFFSSLGYLGIALALMIEIIPSEIVLAYGGFLIAEGHINFVGAVIAGTIGGLIAQLFLYWIGLYGGRAFVEKYGKYIFLHKKHIDLSEKWFLKYGNAVVFFARFIPVVRHAISVPDGLAKMSLGRFIGFTLVAMIPWSILFLELGYQLKSNWAKINSVSGPYVHQAMYGAIGLLAIYAVIVMLKNKITKKDKQVI
jgi:membrane protein DedA with SNARE-associated domain